MTNDSVLGQALGQLGTVIKDTAKQVVKIPSQAAEDVEKQIAGNVKDKDQDTQDKKTESVSQNDSKKQTGEVVRSFYAKSPQSTDDEFRKQIKDKSPEEQKKLLELRQKLHRETYYDPTFNPPKQQEERPAEKVENENKQEMQELEQKEAKKPPPLVQRARERVERFPGASG